MFAKNKGIEYIEVSALNASNVHLVFETIGKHILHRKKGQQPPIQGDKVGSQEAGKKLQNSLRNSKESFQNKCCWLWNYFIQFPNKNAKEISLILVFLHSRLASIFDLISSIVDDILLTFSSLMLSFSPFSSSKTIFVLHGESSDPSCSETLMYFGFIPAVRGSGFLKSGLAKSVKLPKFNFPSFSFSEALFFNFFTFLCSKLSISSKIWNIV